MQLDIHNKPLDAAMAYEQGRRDGERAGWERGRREEWKNTTSFLKDALHRAGFSKEQSHAFRVEFNALRQKVHAELGFVPQEPPLDAMEKGGKA